MSQEPPAHRRLAENEVIARKQNRDVEKGFKHIRALTKKEGHDSFIKDDDTSLHFHCECSNRTCDARIVIPPSEYNALHEANDQFIVVPGHEMPEIEYVIARHPAYNIIRKYFEPPAEAEPGASQTAAQPQAAPPADPGTAKETATQLQMPSTTPAQGPPTTSKTPPTPPEQQPK